MRLCLKFHPQERWLPAKQGSKEGLILSTRVELLTAKTSALGDNDEDIDVERFSRALGALDLTPMIRDVAKDIALSTVQPTGEHSMDSRSPLANSRAPRKFKVISLLDVRGAPATPSLTLRPC